MGRGRGQRTDSVLEKNKPICLQPIILQVFAHFYHVLVTALGTGDAAVKGARIHVLTGVYILLGRCLFRMRDREKCYREKNQGQDLRSAGGGYSKSHGQGRTQWQTAM